MFVTDKRTEWHIEHSSSQIVKSESFVNQIRFSDWFEHRNHSRLFNLEKENNFFFQNIQFKKTDRK